MKIDKTAIVDSRAKIGEGVEIGPYSIVEEHVEIGAGTEILPFCHIKGSTKIGKNNLIHTGSVIGEKPQMLGLKKQLGHLLIGDDNIIREYATINTSTEEENRTEIGSNNYLMSFSHIAHDCCLKNNITISNGSLLAGHVEIEEGVTISANTAIHQFVRIGRLAMIGGLSRVTKDVPPFMMLIGNSKIFGINRVGIKRAGFSNEEIDEVKKAYTIIYRKRLPLNKIIEELKKIESTKAKEIIAFIESSKRGISGGKTSNLLEKTFLNYPLSVRQRIDTYKLFKKRDR
ncbi:MAG: acyl-ACP--UDP-N-acetylglucosamine O-acyltransferase [Candidatus Kaelpia imicola]|nr:acyl-ACP--UDP-N-acetylglucosamine O-acyltransferase [Candidatus Kaelpia imicola]